VSAGPEDSGPFHFLGSPRDTCQNEREWNDTVMRAAKRTAGVRQLFGGPSWSFAQRPCDRRTLQGKRNGGHRQRGGGHPKERLMAVRHCPWPFVGAVPLVGLPSGPMHFRWRRPLPALSQANCSMKPANSHDSQSENMNDVSIAGRRHTGNWRTHHSAPSWHSHLPGCEIIPQICVC
jgi:hypothetical protein